MQRIAHRLWGKISGPRDTIALFVRKSPGYLPGTYHICLPRDPATGKVVPGVQINGLTFSGSRRAPKSVPGVEVSVSSTAPTVTRVATSGQGGQFSIRYGTPPTNLPPRRVGIRLYKNDPASLADMNVSLLTLARYNLDRFRGRRADNLTQRGPGAEARGRGGGRHLCEGVQRRP